MAQDPNLRGIMVDDLSRGRRPLGSLGGVAEYATDASGNVTGLMGPDGELLELSYASPPEVPLFTWMSADSGTNTSVATGTPVTTHAIDISTVQDGTFNFVHTGGTLAITYQMSDDGYIWSSAISLASGLAAGTYSYSVPSSRLNYVRFTFTATGSTCSVKAYLMATEVNSSSSVRDAKRSVFGDGGVSISMAISGTIVSPPIDLRYAVRSKSKIVVIVGSGTVKVSGQISRDGVNNLYSLGDLKTGMTAGMHVIDLATDVLLYGHFLTLTCTETAGATAAVGGYAMLALADEFVESPGVRAAVAVPRLGFAGADWTIHAPVTMNAYSMLLRLGYDAELLSLDDTSAIFDGGERIYDFLVWPHANHGGLWNTWTSGSGRPISRMCKGETQMPVLVIGVTSNNNATLLANIGAGPRDTEGHRKVLFGGVPCYMIAGAYTVTQQAHMNNYSVWATESTATTPVAWTYTGASGPVYVIAGFQNITGLALALVKAISDGVIDAPPRRARAVIDIDDFPDCSGSPSVQTVADMDRVYSAISRADMPISMGIRPEDIAAGRQSAAINTWISQKPYLLYPIAHSGNWLWKDGAKTVKDAAYRADLSTMEGAGISANADAYGYYYFNSNAFDEETVQLAQQAKNYLASPSNGAATTGYGWKVIRADVLNATNTEGIGEPQSVYGFCYQRGARIIHSYNHISSTNYSINFDDGSTGTTAISLQINRFIEHCICLPGAFYIHGSNCYDGHGGGNAPGTRWLELLAGLYEYGLNAIVQFVHGSDLDDRVW